MVLIVSVLQEAFEALELNNINIIILLISCENGTEEKKKDSLWHLVPKHLKLM